MGKENPLFKIVATVQLDDGSVVSVIAPSRIWDFSEVKTSVLGVWAGVCGRCFKKLLIKRGHTISIEQAAETLQKTDVLNSGIFFRETGDGRKPVEIGCIDRGGLRHRPDIGFSGRFSPFFCLIVRNLDMSKFKADDDAVEKVSVLFLG